MANRMQPVHGLLVEKAAAAALSAPSASTDGVDITGWRQYSSAAGHTVAVLAIDSSTTTTLTSPTLYGYGPYGPAAASQWFSLGTLNSGSSIALTAGVGFAQVIQFPCAFTRLAIGATVSAGDVGYTLTPQMVTEQ